MKKIEPIRYEDGRPMLLAGIRQHHGFTEAVNTIPEQWKGFHALEKIPGQIEGVAYGVICGHDAAAGTFEYMCGIEVESFDALPTEVGRIRIHAQHYAVFLHSGHISDIRITCQRIWNEWLPNSSYQSANKPDFEKYDHRFNRGTKSGEVEFWLSIADKVV